MNESFRERKSLKLSNHKCPGNFLIEKMQTKNKNSIISNISKENCENLPKKKSVHRSIGFY